MYFNLPRYFKYYDEAKHTPFTPALPVLYAYREAMRIILEEGMEKEFKDIEPVLMLYTLDFQQLD